MGVSCVILTSKKAHRNTPAVARSVHEAQIPLQNCTTDALSSAEYVGVVHLRPPRWIRLGAGMNFGDMLRGLIVKICSCP